MAQIDIDGKRVNIPDYMLDATGEKLAKQMDASKKIGAESLVVLKKLLKAWDDSFDEAKSLKDEVSEVIKSIDEQTDTTNRENRQNTEYTVKSFSNSIRQVHNALLKTDKWVLGAIGVATTALTVAAGQIVGQFLSISSAAKDLNTYGQGLSDNAGDLAKSMGEFNLLGLSGADATAAMQSFADVVSIQGRNAFVEAAQAMSAASNAGVSLGLTMNEAVHVLGQDLQLRRRLGMMSITDQKAEAKRSTDLYKRQLAMANATGTSIDSIRSAGESLAENSEFMMMLNRIAFTNTANTASKLMTSMQETIGDLAAMGVDDSILNSISSTMTGLDTMLTDGGQQLFTSLQVIGTEGSRRMFRSIDQMNDAMRKGDFTGFDTAKAQMEKDLVTIGKEVRKMTPRAFEQLMLRSDEHGRALIQSAMKAADTEERVAKARAAQRNNEMVNEATAAATFENTMAKLGASFEYMRNQVVVQLMPTLEALTEVFSDEEVQTGFVNMVKTIGRTLAEAFGFVNVESENLAKTIKGKLIDGMRKLADWFANNKDTIADTFATVGNAVMTLGESVMSAVSFVIGFSETIGGVIKGIASLFGVDTETKKVKDAVTGEMRDETAAEKGKRLGDSIAKGILIYAGFSLAVKGMTAAITGAQGLMWAFGLLTTSLRGLAGAGAGQSLFGAIASNMAQAGSKVVKGGIAAILGTAAEYGGDYLKEKGYEKTGTALSVAGNTAQWAGTGAMVGSMFGPAGTLIGAAAGGLYGLGMGLYDNGLLTFGDDSPNTANSNNNQQAQQRTPVTTEQIIQQTSQAQREQIVDTMTKTDTKKVEAASKAIATAATSLNALQDSVDIEKQSRVVDVFTMFSTLDTDKIEQSASALSTLTDSYIRFSNINSSALYRTAMAVEKMNQAFERTWTDVAKDAASSLFGVNDKMDITSPTFNEIQYQAVIDKSLSESELNTLDPGQRAIIEMLAQIVSNTGAGAKTSRKLVSVIEELDR